MINQRMIFEIYRLSNEGYSVRRIARILNLNRKTVVKYLEDPNPKRPVIKRPSKLDPFKKEISNILEIDPKASAVVICQRITSLGFDGEITILRDYLRKIRGRSRKRQPFISFESPPEQQCQIDWGHFGSITYGNISRKLYCMAGIESYSRLLNLEFTHFQKQESLHRCLLNAFRLFNGTPKELVHDNIITADIERDGPLIRFNEAFLLFLMPFKIVPIACNVASPHDCHHLQMFLNATVFPVPHQRVYGAADG